MRATFSSLFFVAAASGCLPGTSPVYYSQPAPAPPPVRVIESRPPPVRVIESRPPQPPPETVREVRIDNKAEEKALREENKAEAKALHQQNKAEEKALRRRNKIEEKEIKRSLKGK